jgi:hypothetical protein
MCKAAPTAAATVIRVKEGAKALKETNASYPQAYVTLALKRLFSSS